MSCQGKFEYWRELVLVLLMLSVLVLDLTLFENPGFYGEDDSRKTAVIKADQRNGGKGES